MASGDAVIVLVRVVLVRVFVVEDSVRVEDSMRVDDVCVPVVEDVLVSVVMVDVLEVTEEVVAVALVEVELALVVVDV